MWCWVDRSRSWSLVDLIFRGRPNQLADVGLCELVEILDRIERDSPEATIRRPTSNTCELGERLVAARNSPASAYVFSSNFATKVGGVRHDLLQKTWSISGAYRS